MDREGCHARAQVGAISAPEGRHDRRDDRTSCEVALSLERRERGRVGSVDAAREQLAGLLGVSRTTVARWETGTRKLGKDWLTKVARKTGIAPAKLRPDLAELMRV